LPSQRQRSGQTLLLAHFAEAARVLLVADRISPIVELSERLHDGIKQLSPSCQSHPVCRRFHIAIDGARCERQPKSPAGTTAQPRAAAAREFRAWNGGVGSLA
jgi:hypothetical protein